MKSRQPRRPAADVPGQIQIDWKAEPLPAAVRPKEAGPTAAATEHSTAPPRESVGTLRLPWDFHDTFPEPTEQAIDAGIISAEDLSPENIRGIHEEHVREMLATLHELDAVLDARRRGVDPRNNKTPMLAEAKERLRKFFETEPRRLERWFENLLGVYADAFGNDAAESFGKAVRAWHAGVEVIAETQRSTPPIEPAAVRETPLLAVATPAASATEPTPLDDSSHRTRSQSHRVVARRPVPRPLPEAIAQGRFGFDESQRPIRPGPDEVREITERHAEKLIELLDGLRQVETWLSSSQCSDQARLYRERDLLNGRVQSALTAYAEDFGTHAAQQLEAYARRQAQFQEAPSSAPGHRR